MLSPFFWHQRPLAVDVDVLKCSNSSRTQWFLESATWKEVRRWSCTWTARLQNVKVQSQNLRKLWQSGWEGGNKDWFCGGQIVVSEKRVSKKVSKCTTGATSGNSVETTRHTWLAGFSTSPPLSTPSFVRTRLERSVNTFALRNFAQLSYLWTVSQSNAWWW